MGTLMADMSQLNFVDILILIVFFISMTMGFARGLVSEVISLAALIAAIFFAAMFSNQLATYFTSSQSVQDVVAQTSNVIGTSTAQPVSYMALGISFALIFLGVLFIGSFIKYLLN